MNVTKGSAPTLSATVDAATNRLGVGTYDANGNQVTGLPAGGYSYDVENRMISPGSADIIYAYSPSNQRVWKGTYNVDQFFNWTLASQEVYFYGVDGKRLGTYSVAPNPPLGTSIIATELFVYFGQKMVGKSFSPYQVTSFVPFVGNRVGSNGDYYPYGQDKGTPLPNDEVKFATYTRDSATGLDYAMNRYYSNSLGRFTSPDPYLDNTGGPGDPEDPESWNRYAYTRGDPVNRRDPNGLQDCGTEDNPIACAGPPVLFPSGFQPPASTPLKGRLPKKPLRPFVWGRYEAWKALSNPDCAAALGAASPTAAQARFTSTPITFGYSNPITATPVVGPLQEGQAQPYLYNANPAYELDGQIVLNGFVNFFNPDSTQATTPSGGKVPVQYLEGTISSYHLSSLTGVQFDAIVLLHEFGHVTGVFGDDGNNQLSPDGKESLSEYFTRQVIDHCFPELLSH